MTSVFSTATSGLDLATLQDQVSANNVVNAQMPGFVPSRVDSTTQAAGGVSATAQQVGNPQVESNIDRNLAALSQVDLAAEVVAQQLAVASFRANLAVVRAAEAEQQAVVSIRS